MSYIRRSGSQATAAEVAVIDANVDAILEDTGTTLDGIVDDILTDTNAMPDNGAFTTMTTQTNLIPPATQETYEQQADAVLSQANPVSGTKYTVLDTTGDVRIQSIAANVTWATTQPTPLEVWVTIDGQTLRYYADDPVSATWYYDKAVPNAVPASQQLSTSSVAQYRGFILEGRSVKVEIEITWATTQPTPLNCTVKYAKM